MDTDRYQPESQDRTILCVATRLWDSLWRDSQQVMSRLSAHNKVIYFEPGRDPDMPHVREMARNLPNFVSDRSRQISENLLVVPTPSCLPYGRKNLPAPMLRITTPLVARTNALILIRHIRRTMKKLGIRRPILWLYEPRHVGLIGKFGEQLVCYYNYDELAEFNGNERIKPLLQQYDERLSRRADVVFSTSRAQWERRKKLNPNAYFVPNGVDFELFNRALDRATVIPSEVVGLRKPVIGFIGFMSYHVDAELLVRVAESYPQASVVLVGPDCLPDNENTRRLHEAPNVYFLGRKGLLELPGYLKAFSVALIPWIIRGHTLTAYPLKLHEYLAAGKAIVATPAPELYPFGNLVRIGETPEQFIEQIARALQDNSPQAVSARVETARENTWDKRVDAICEILNRSVEEGKQVEAHLYRLDTLQPAK